jgi:lipoprotein-releasing system permease protein
VYRLHLASRYTFARPVSYLAMVAIGLAVMALIVVLSIMNGFLEETRSFLRGTTADIVVFPHQARYAYSRDVLEGAVAEHPDVASACARLVRPGIFKVHGRPPVFHGNSLSASQHQVLVLGVDAKSEIKSTDFAEYLDRVENPEFRVADPSDPFDLPVEDIREREFLYTQSPTVLISEEMMRGLLLQRGDALTIVTVPDSALQLDGAPVRPASQTFLVTGAYNTGHYSHDQANVYMSTEDFRSWSGTQHEVSELYVAVSPAADLSVVRDELDAKLRSIGLAGQVETWEDRHRVWLGAVENERNILLVIFLFFLLLVCTITFSVLTMMVQQKVRDIGILSAMGAPAGGVGAVFAVCGIYIATLGGLFGLVSGVALAANINKVKDALENLLGIEIFKKEIYAFSEIPVALDHTLNIAIAGVTVVGAVLICMMPAFRAARMDPVEALRHE